MKGFLVYLCDVYKHWIRSGNETYIDPTTNGPPKSGRIYGVVVGRGSTVAPKGLGCDYCRFYASSFTIFIHDL